MVCHRMCDYHHYHLEEEERLTTMVTTTGEKAQGEGCHYDTMTRKTITITATQDRLQERFERKRTTTSSDYIIRLTDRLLRCGTKIISCFSQKQGQIHQKCRKSNLLSIPDVSVFARLFVIAVFFLSSQEPLRMPVFFISCFPRNFQEGKRPVKALGETAHEGRKTAH